MSEPNPKKATALKLHPDTVWQYKKYNCVFYEKCIDFAVERNWSQFDCSACHAYQKDESLPDPENPGSFEQEVEVGVDFDFGDFDE